MKGILSWLGGGGEGLSIQGTSHRYPDLRKLPRDLVRIGCERSRVSSVFPAPSSSPSPDNKLPFELTRGVIHRTQASRLRRKLPKIPVRVGCDRSQVSSVYSSSSSSRSPDNELSLELTWGGGHSLNTGVSSSAETTEGFSQSRLWWQAFFTPAKITQAKNNSKFQKKTSPKNAKMYPIFERNSSICWKKLKNFCKKLTLQETLLASGFQFTFRNIACIQMNWA